MRNNPSKTDLFKARHVEQEIIILCVRFYLRYKLPCRDARRNIATVKAFFLKAIGSQGRSPRLSRRTAVQPCTEPFTNFNSRKASPTDDAPLVEMREQSNRAEPAQCGVHAWH